MSRAFRPALPALLLAAATAPVLAQHPNHDTGLRPERALDASGLETVNLGNGNLTLTIPLGGRYPLGPELSYGLTLTWTGNLWEWEEKSDPDTGEAYLQSQPRSRSNAGFGWELSLGRFLRSFDPENPSPHHAYMGPDQALHELERGALHLGKESFPGVRFSKDGTYLRRIDDEARVEFPDGSARIFESGRLVRLEDPFGHALTITYSSFSGGDPLVWELADTHGREHRIEFAKRSGRLVLSEVQLEKFGGGTPAVYGFAYENETLPRACNAPVDCGGSPCGDTSDVTLPLLTRVSLPDGTAYAVPADRHYESTAFCTAESGRRDRQLTGSLERLELPTGGAFEYTWQSWEFPVESANLPNGDGEPTGGSENPFRFGAGLAERRHMTRSDGVLGRWEYDPEITPPDPGTAEGELVVTVTARPNGETTKHYFSVYAEPVDLASGWSRDDYGLPFTRDTTDGSSPGRFLSREIFDKQGTKLRSVYVRYEDSGFGENPRVVSRRTVYHDDGDRRADVDLSDFDGLGHHRTVTTAGTFPGQNERTAKINWNPGRSVDDIPDPDEPWVLDVYDRTRVTEGSQTVTREFHFDLRGFLQRTRIRQSAACGSTDVIVDRTRFPDSHASAGFLAREDFYGGDHGSLPCVTLASVDLDAEPVVYKRKHDHSCGVHRESRWFAPDGTALNFKSPDLDVDCDSGLVLRSRDTAGLTTTFDYDELGRLTRAAPQAGQGAVTTYRYDREGTSGGLPARVTILRKNGSTVLTEEQVRLDGFGRVARERRKMPDGTFAVRRTLWSSRGWMDQRSEWEAEGDGDRSWTLFRGYDPFGRPGRITLPDGQAITLSYKGESSRTVTVGVATDLGTTGQPVLSNASTTETYDRFGRLHELREPRLADGSRTRTLYSYDAQGNLTRVDMNAGASPVQTRRFSYDGRGFLTFESHPELGVALRYSEYDPLGNPGRVRRGLDSTVEGAWDLEHDYDAAGRLREIRERASGRVWKEWTYATANHQAGRWSNGKLAEAVRHNHVRNPATGGTFDAEVRERYEYDGVGGRISRVLTDVPTAGDPEENTRPTFGYELAYDPLGNVASRDYPECSHKFCIDVNEPLTVPQSFTQGFLTSIPGYASSIRYHPNGLPERVAHTNGVTDLQDRDPDDMTRPRKLRTSGASHDFDSGVYAYDGAGNVTNMGAHRYVYDHLSRVREAQVQVPGEGCGETLELPSSTETGSASHESCGTIEAGGGYTVGATGSVALRAGSRVALTDGFTVESGGRLEAGVDPDLDPDGGATEASQSYEFDRFGNLLEVTTGREGEPDKTRTIGTVSSTNRLSVASYDVAGNVTQWAGREYAWDPFGMLWQTKPTNGNGVTFVYGPGDERFWTVDWTRGTNSANWLETWTLRDLDGSVLRQYRSDGGNQGGNWSLHRDYIRRGSSLLAAESPEGRRHFHLDHLGSPRLITDGQGTTQAQHLYFPFGEEATDPGQDAEVMKFTAHQRDFFHPNPPIDPHDPNDQDGLRNTLDDLDYMHARYFSAHLGRFQSVDPIGGAPSSPQSWNRYAYVLGNPMKYTDPRGLFPGLFEPLNQYAGAFLASMNFITVTDSPFLFSPGSASIPFRGRRSSSSGILNSLQATGDSLVALGAWATGQLPSTGVATPEMTAQLANTPAMENIREAYKETGCKDDRYSSDFQYRELATTTNVTGQLVGGFVADITSAGGGMIVVNAQNTWGLESATRFPGVGNRGNASVQQMLSGAGSFQYPKSILEDRAHGPMGNARLHYIWAEPSPCP